MFCKTPVLSTGILFNFFIARFCFGCKTRQFWLENRFELELLELRNAKFCSQCRHNIRYANRFPKFLIMKRNSNTVFCINTNTEYEPKTKIERNNPYTKNPQFGQAIRGSKQEQNTSS